MSFGRGMAATYVSQIVVAVVGFAVLPLLLARLGLESYALVGFFATLLGWFQLLDLGLSASVTREVARYRGGALTGSQLRHIVRAVGLVFAAIASVACLVTAASAGILAEQWLRSGSLPPGSVHVSLLLMALTIAARFVCIHFRAVLTGFERLEWLAGANVTITVLRSVVVLPVLDGMGPRPETYFAYQLFVGVFEVVVLGWRARRELPATHDPLRWSLAPLRALAPVSLAVALTGGLGVVIAQSDRLILSGLLTLSAYGQFQVCVLAASAVLLSGAPIAASLHARLGAQYAANDHAAFTDTLRIGAGVMTAVTFGPALVLALHAQHVLEAWTGRGDLFRDSAVTVALYAMGNAIHAQLALPYAAQLAAGRLRRHVVGNVIFVLLLVPGQVLMTLRFGAVGAGLFWLLVNALYALAWAPYAMGAALPSLARLWLGSFARAAIPTAVLAALSLPLIDQAAAHGRLAGAIALLVLSFVLVCSGMGSLPEARRRAVRVLHGRRMGSGLR